MSRFQVLRLRVLASLDDRSSGLLVIAGASYLARLGSALTLLLTIPLACRILDSETFGIWMMLSSLLAFFAFADLGVGNGTIA
jgi:O-antigen/teichoic acid export membrane protein